MANLFEMDMTLKDIDANPENHDQGYWGIQLLDTSGTVCGTVMRAAGFTVARHGYTLLFGDLGVAEFCRSPEGKMEPIRDVAARILGLERWEVNAFFAGSNTRADLQRIRDNIAATQ